MLAPAIVIAIRILVPFSILRFPFWGMVLSVLADALDIVIFSWLGWGILEGKGIYHELDKVFDMYYLSFAAYKTLGWQDALARKTSAVLFLWRFAGFAVFEITGIRQIILFAPNIFENFYLLWQATLQFFPESRTLTKKKLAVYLLIAAIPKIIQEYIMHYLEFPTWAFIRHNIFRWPW